MFNQVDKDLILKFLNLNHPIIRVKHKKRFTRAIEVNGFVFILKDMKSYEPLKQKLFDDLIVVFSPKNFLAISDVLDNFLKSKLF